jgi:D-glycero-alpha-D-manno-heptose-7-phosphate kinase
MIITRSPLRITLGGGGTDLPSYYDKNEGFVLSAAIDKYVYVSITKPFVKGIFLKYSKIEIVQNISEIQHPIIREALKMINLEPQIEITTLADIPAGTGLGSSGTFTTALLKALYTNIKHNLNQQELAELACHIEINCLGQPIGKQDQYISSIGGLTSFTFHKKNKEKDKVTFKPLNIKNETMLDLEDNLLLFFTGFSRSANNILIDQNKRSLENDIDMINNLHFVKDLGFKSKEALESDNIELFGRLMHQHWENKKKRSIGMSNSKINKWYNLGIKNGAIGGKVVGAGGGGFLMFLAHNKSLLRKTMIAVGLQEVRFRFDFEGTKIMISD